MAAKKQNKKQKVGQFVKPNEFDLSDDSQYGVSDPSGFGLDFEKFNAQVPSQDIMNETPELPAMDLKSGEVNPMSGEEFGKRLGLGLGAFAGGAGVGKAVETFGVPGLSEGVTAPFRGAGLGLGKLASDVASNVYPLAVAGDLVRKGLDPKIQSQFVEAKPFERARMAGQEIAKSATGESLTSQAGGKYDLGRFASEALGGGIEGVGTGVRSAKNYAEESLFNPVAQGVKEAFNPGGGLEYSSDESLEKSEEAFKARTEAELKAKVEAGLAKAKSDMDNAKSFEEFNAARNTFMNLQNQWKQRGVPTIQAPSDAELQKGTINTQQNPQQGQSAGDVGSAQPKSNVLGDVLKNVFSVGKGLAGMTAYGVPLDLAGRALSPITGDALRIYGGEPTMQDYKARLQDVQRSAYINQGNAPMVQALNQMEANKVANAKALKEEAAKLDIGKMDDKSDQFKKMSDIIVSKKEVDEIMRMTQQAIANGDAGAIGALATRLGGISSVLIQQGVVSDQEMQRTLQGMYKAQKSILEGGFNLQDAPRLLGEDNWKTLLQFGNIVNAGSTARLRGYRDIFEIPDTFFQRAGIDLNTPYDNQGLNPSFGLTRGQIQEANIKSAGEATEQTVESAESGGKKIVKKGGELLDKVVKVVAGTDKKKKAPAKPEKKSGRRDLGE